MLNRKILILVPNLDCGGAERVTVTIARLLKKNGASVSFVNLGIERGEMKNWIEPEFSLISLNCKRTLFAYNKLRKVLANNKGAVVFSSREHTNILALLLSKSYNTTIVRLPNMPNNKLLGKKWTFKQQVIRFLNSQLLKRADHIIAQNKEMEEQASLVYELDKSKIHTIYNPVDSEWIHKQLIDDMKVFPTSGPNYLAVGNVSYAKGYDILIQAFRIVRTYKPTASLYVLGRTNTVYAAQLFSEYLNEPGVFFEGFKENPYNYINQCDVFVLPSRMEGFPNVVLEATVLNKTIVATKCVDVLNSIVIQGENGYLCSVENVQELADGMMNALSLKNGNNSYTLFNQDELLKLFA